MTRTGIGFCLLVCLSVATMAGEATPAPAPGPPVKRAAPAPLPPLSIEGSSGIFLTGGAGIANLPEGDRIIGKPSFAFSGVKIGDKNLASFSASTNFFKRIELSYSYQRLGLGDFPHDVRKATGISIAESSIVHTAGLHAILVREGAFGAPWLPSIGAGVSYKKNETIENINDDLGGLLNTLGYKKDHGVDYTIMATKTLPARWLPRPVIISGGVRNTKAILGGFGGFGGDRHTVFEGNAICLLTKRLVLAGEYRQMPHELRTMGRLIRREDSWWSLALAYVVNEHLTATVGFAHLGRVLNDHYRFCPLGQVKWEF